ncbi:MULTISPECIES: glycerol-3-phosphate cytidylyltransferase [unclassified Marinitoga]|uniref:glycerol-3-phosphate cytidylyltransferase n=1 Tax=unclassified Marinitoga TaxID=2640159 RepID=UPI0006413BD8|nr:glycerol-3-phosphate cytidiltransferase [Marinitoga sp. 1155]NUU99628.1 glycerol-3-phosphate cytidiltransferase [Marinitoga sp. 1154]
MKKKIVITYGTFDLFHIGHLKLLQRAKELGDKLIVAVSTDDFNKIKGKKSIIPYEQRVEIVRNIKCVDMVIPENSWDQKIEDIKKYKVDIFVMGEDWKGKFDFLKKYCEVVYLQRTEGISSTEIKNILQHISKLSTTELKKALDILTKIDFEELKEAFIILEQLRKDLW